MSGTQVARAVVVGLGPHGRRVVTALRSTSNVAVAALVDKSEKALSHADLPADAARSGDYAAALAAGADLVCICTNGPSHAALALQALEAGARYLLISKPLACSVDECERILAAAKAKGARVAVDHIRRLHPTYRFLREQIAAGRWGQPRSLYMQRPGIGLGCNGTHSFDAVRFLVGREIAHVTGWVDTPKGPNPRGADFVDPGGLSVLSFGDDCRATVAQVEDGAGPTSLEIDLTAGRIRYEERTGALEIIERDLSVKPAPGKPASFRAAEPPPGVAATVDMHAGLTALAHELLGTGPMECDALHGLRSIQALAATYRSHSEQHRPVDPASRELASLWMPIT